MNNDVLYGSIIACAIKIIARPKCWTQKAHARNDDREPCPPWSSEASSWCFYGAVVKVSFDSCGDLRQALATAYRIRRSIASRAGDDPIRVNDLRGRHA